MRRARDLKASEKKTCRWHVFRESVAETLSYIHTAASVYNGCFQANRTCPPPKQQTPIRVSVVFYDLDKGFEKALRKRLKIF